MQDEATVGATDIARLAGVGRAAVSNWRRRHPDFPQPVGGTPTSPTFLLTQVEGWLRDQGKLDELPQRERAWQLVRAEAGDDLRLAEALGTVGEVLMTGRTPNTEAGRAIGELATAQGVDETFEFLYGRFRETQARRGSDTPYEIAQLMAALAKGSQTVLDPAAGTGELLIAALAEGAGRLLGQEAEPAYARLAEIRLALRAGTHRSVRLPEHAAADRNRLPGSTVRATVSVGDSLLGDAFPGALVDAVLCDPPFHQRVWGHDELTRDPRWQYGLPPRLEPELAWVQHAVAHLAPGGLAVVLMPPVAAGRRSGRRVRAQLIRRGALRAVVSLSASHQLWLLQRPDGTVPATALMIDSSDHETVVATWRQHRDDPDHDVPGVSRSVPLIDLLDEDVDVTPALHLSAAGAGRTTERFLAAHAELSGLAAGLGALLPDVRPGPQKVDVPLVSLAELARIGHLTIQQAPLRREADDDAGHGEPLLTAEDVLMGRAATGRVPAGERWIVTQAGDVVVAVVGGEFGARVLDTGGALLGPQLSLLRADPLHLDAQFVAGALRGSANVRASTVQSGGFGRLDPRRTQLPVLPLETQRRCGEAFRRMAAFESAVQSAVTGGAELARLLADGITEGTVLP